MPGHHGLAERADRLLTTRILKSQIGTYSHIKRDQLFKERGELKRKEDDAKNEMR